MPYRLISHAGKTLDLWTWHDREEDYPTGTRTYVKLVEAGQDLTVGNAAVQSLADSVPLSGHCSAP